MRDAPLSPIFLVCGQLDIVFHERRLLETVVSEGADDQDQGCQDKVGEAPQEFVVRDRQKTDGSAYVEGDPTDSLTEHDGAYVFRWEHPTQSESASLNDTSKDPENN